MPLSRLQPTEVQSDMPHNGGSITLDWRGRDDGDGARRKPEPRSIGVAPLRNNPALAGSGQLVQTILAAGSPRAFDVPTAARRSIDAIRAG